MTKLTYEPSNDQWFVGNHALHVGDLVLAKHPRHHEVSTRIWMIDRDVEAVWYLSSNGTPLDDSVENPKRLSIF